MLKKILRIGILGTAAVVLAAVLFVGISNLIIIGQGKKKIVPESEMGVQNADCIMILGAGIRRDNKPSQILTDRLKVGADGRKLLRIETCHLYDSGLYRPDQGRVSGV